MWGRCRPVMARHDPSPALPLLPLFPDPRLRLRFVTGVLIACGAVAAPLSLPSDSFSWLLWGIATLGIWEWGRLLNRSRLNLVAGLGVWFLVSALLTCHPCWFVSLFVLQWGLLMPWQFYRPFSHHGAVQFSWFVSGLVALGLAWAALSGLHREFSPAHALFFMLLIAAADTVAFFVGRACGRHRLAPQLSPGKTWEGALGALAIALVMGVLGAAWLAVARPGGFIALCLVTVGISILGDVYESLLKRRANAKDSSHLLPGHGGVLDRIDSHLAASPLFYLAFFWGIVT